MEIRYNYCSCKKDGKTVVAGDGQVTMGESVILKGTAKKGKTFVQRFCCSRICW